MFFQVPSREIDKAETRFWTHWNRETKQVLFIQHKHSSILSKKDVVHQCCSSSQFFLQFHFKMEKMLLPVGGPPLPVGVKRPPPLMSAIDGHPGSDSMPPPPPGGMSIPPLPPGATGVHHMPPHMPPMPMRPPPPDGL